MKIEELFKVGMKRDIIPLRDDYGLQLELGGAAHPVDSKVIQLDYQSGWDANKDATMPLDNEWVDVIHAYHFLEHLDEPQHVLHECQRVLRPGVHMNIVVPYYNSQLQCSCFEHKSFFSEEVWEHLFEKNCNKYNYQWEFQVGTNIIIGVVERNLCLMTQLIKP